MNSTTNASTESKITKTPNLRRGRLHTWSPHSGLGPGELSSPRGSDADILRAYASLTLADLEAAWVYAAANSIEIDRAIQENEAGEEGLVE